MNSQDKDEIRKSILENDGEIMDQAEKSNVVLNHIIKTESALTAAIYYSNLSSLGQEKKSSKFQNIVQSLEDNKIETSLKSGMVPVPEYLKRYVNLELQSPKDNKESIFVKLSKSGIQLINSIVEKMEITPMVQLAPITRSTTKEMSEYLVFEEKATDDEKFVYQIIQEKPEEAFLSVKIDSPNIGKYERVNLKKDGRFILSSQLNDESVANFTGLKEGKYTVEFQGQDVAKSLDLYVLIE